MNDTDLTLDGALAAGECGGVHGWLQRFLRSDEGLNLSLAEHFAHVPPRYEGPKRIALAQMRRIAGPEPTMDWPADDPVLWEADVAAKMESIAMGWNPPPLVAHAESLALSDGNRRYEALRRSGRRDYWTILFS
jgi:hypothetical protein